MDLKSIILISENYGVHFMDFKSIKYIYFMELNYGLGKMKKKGLVGKQAVVGRPLAPLQVLAVVPEHPNVDLLFTQTRQLYFISLRASAGTFC